MASSSRTSISIDAGEEDSELSELDSWESDDKSYRKRTLDEDAPNQPTKKKKKKTAYKTWSHARKARTGEPLRDKHGHELWYCGYCNHKSATTHRARQHLRKKHGITVIEDDGPVKKKAKHTIEGIFGKQAAQQYGRDIEQEKHLKRAINQEAINEALTQLITVRNLSHHIVEWPELRALIHAVNYMADDVLPLAHSSIKKIIEQAYFSHKALIKQRLQTSLTKIHFTVDMWTAPSHTGYQAIVAHFVDGQTRRPAKILLALREHEGSHGGEPQAEVFLEVADEYEIRDNIGYFTTDNHPSNDKMLRFLAKELYKFNPVHRRLRCNGHVINLAVQAFFLAKDTAAVEESIRQAEQRLEDEQSGQRERVDTAAEWRQMGPLGKLHNLIMAIRASTQRYNQFKALAGRMIPRDNDTRWNSWFFMLDISLKKRKEIISFVDEFFNEIELDYLYPNDWSILREYHSFLKPFQQITKLTEGDNSTLDEVLVGMDFLVKHLNKALKQYENDLTTHSRIMTCFYAFDKYYKKTDDTPAYAAAILLHPSLRKDYLDSQWSHQREYINPAIAAVRKEWKEYKRESTPVPKTDEIDEFKAWRDEVFKMTSGEDEFERFIHVRALITIVRRTNV
jgi:hypothetical protein